MSGELRPDYQFDYQQAKPNRFAEDGPVPPTLESLGIDRLPVADRIALALQIWDSVADEADATPLTESQRAELERRWADDEANPDDVVPWEQVKADALARWLQ